ncbi:MAG: exosortase family protein XrtG [Lachnospiraceae bacterium]|nr:exosortase family protein XrtG [Lachnospiraceae bacterium]
MSILVGLIFIVWIYILWVLKRAKLSFWRFLLGSVGLFVFQMIWLQPLMTEPLTKAVTVVVGQLGELTGMFDAYQQYSILFIPKSTAAVSLFVDFECSGVIEIMAYLSLLWFFDVYDAIEKVILTVAGIVAIFLFNVIRIFSICTMIYFFGNNVFYFAHAIFGRIVFYVLSISLYFYIFTKAQIVRQKIGSFKYVTEKETEEATGEGETEEYE